MAKYDYGGGCPCGLYKECEPQCEYYRPLDQQSTPKVKKKEDYDFGFSFGDSTEFSTEVDIATEKLEKLRGMILPFLNNLKQNPEKDIIKWEGKDRVKKIDDFIKKINELVDS